MTSIKTIIEQIRKELAIATAYYQVEEALAKFDYSRIDEMAQEFLN